MTRIFGVYFKFVLQLKSVMFLLNFAGRVHHSGSSPSETRRSHTTLTMNAVSEAVWYAWLGGTLSFSWFAASLPPLVYFSVIIGALCCISGLPDIATSAAPFFLHLIMPLVTMKGFADGGIWLLNGVWFAFCFLPIADACVGHALPKLPAPNAKSIGFRLALASFPPMQLALMMRVCFVMSSGAWSIGEAVMASFSAAAYSGAFGMVVCHELVHRRGWERLVGLALCCAVFYPHFEKEHCSVHHRLVGTDDDPDTARWGENLYAFYKRATVGGVVKLLEYERERSASERKSAYSSIMMMTVVSVAFASALVYMYGPSCLVLIFTQSIFATLLFKAVNYIQHYGLERSQGDAVDIEHSWDAPYRVSTYLTFNLPDHGAHHRNASLRYPALFHEEGGPELPAGYPTMILLALVPPLWMRVMNPLVLRVRKEISHKEGSTSSSTGGSAPRKWRHGNSSS